MSRVILGTMFYEDVAEEQGYLMRMFYEDVADGREVI